MLAINLQAQPKQAPVFAQQFGRKADEIFCLDAHSNYLGMLCECFVVL